MKASTLIKYLQTIIEDFNIDPDVVINVNGKSSPLAIAGKEGVSTYDYPNQTDGMRTQSIIVHLRPVEE